MRKYMMYAALMLAATSLAGCGVPLVLGAVAGAGYVGLQQRSTEQVASDAAIKLALKNEITKRYYQYFADVGVDVFYGDVLLTGIVPTQAEGEKILDLARRTQGVKKVYNELFEGAAYTTTQKTKDAWIAAQIKPRLIGAKDAYPLNYLITVVNSHVYIMGSTATAAEKNHVLHIIRTVKGVQQVHDYLAIEGDPTQEGRPNVVKQTDMFANGEVRQPDPLADVQ